MLLFIVYFLSLNVISVKSQDMKDSTDPSLFSANQNSKYRISHYDLLLPTCGSTSGTTTSRCHGVYAYLSVNAGNFRWSSDSKLIEIIPVESTMTSPGCYKEVKIYAETSHNFKENEKVLIKATHQDSLIVLTCEVHFSELKKLSVMKTSDQISLEGKRELKVEGFNKDGDIFSSLLGWEFTWSLIRGGENASLMKLSEGSIEVDEIRRNIELNKGQSDVVLVSGISIGEFEVIARPKEGNLDSVECISKVMQVSERFMIVPEYALYLLPTSKYNLGIKYTSSGKLVQQAEFSFFKWNVSDPECGLVKGFGNFEALEKACVVKVTAVDTRLKEKNIAEKTIFIVFPDSLELGYLDLSTLSNDDKNDKISKNLMERFKVTNNDDNSYFKFLFTSEWILVIGKKYIFKNFLKYQGHFIYDNGKSLKYNFELSNLHPYIQNGYADFYFNKLASAVTIIKKSEDKPIIESSVEIYKNLLKTKKLINIVPPIKIEKYGMRYFTLPFIGYNDNGQLIQQELYLNITGGSGEYKIISFNKDVIEVKEDKIIYSKYPGVSTVQVIDSFCPSNKDTFEIKVEEVQEFSQFELLQEVTLNSKVQLTPIAMTKKASSLVQYQYKIYTNCTRIPVYNSINGGNLPNSIESIENNNNLNNEVNHIHEILHKINNINSEYSNSVKDYIINNQAIVNDKLKYLNINNNEDTINGNNINDYINYANFGICQIETFNAINLGLAEYEHAFNFRSKIGNLRNPIKISSKMASKIFVYGDVKIEKTIKDPFTLDLFTSGSLFTSAFNSGNVQKANQNLKNPDDLKSFLITEGSGLVLEFQGGIQPWTGREKDFRLDRFFANDQNAELIADKNKKFSIESLGTKKIYITQKSSNFKYKIILRFQNNKSIDLLRPGKSEVSFEIQSDSIASLSLFLLEKTINKRKNSNMNQINQINKIFANPQVQDIKYYAKINSTDLIRVYAFNKEGIIFSNFTSFKGYFVNNEENIKDGIKDYYYQFINKEHFENLPNSFTNLTTSLLGFKGYDSNNNNKLGSLYNLNNNNLDSLNIYDKEHENFIQSLVLFKGKEKTLKITYIISNIKVEQRCIINIIEPAFILPNRETIYNSITSNLKLKIHKGSGNFKVKLISNNYYDNNYNNNGNLYGNLNLIEPRSMLFSPKQIGDLIIVAEDQEFLNDNDINFKQTNANIRVLSIGKIELKGSELLKMGNSTILNVTLYDNDLKQFKDEEVANIPLEVEFEGSAGGINTYDDSINSNINGNNNININNINGINSLNNNYLSFTFINNNKNLKVTGLKEGLYYITVKEKLNSNRKSEQHRLEVFNEIKIFPKDLYLYPQESYTLSLIGEPLKNTKVAYIYSIEDPYVATVYSPTLPIITAKHIGKTFVTVTLIYNNTKSSSYFSKDVGNEPSLVLCQEKVPVEVDFPEFIKIEGGGEKRKIDFQATIRLRALLMKGRRTFTHGIGPVKFYWNVESLNAEIHFFNKRNSNDPYIEQCTKSTKDGKDAQSDDTKAIERDYTLYKNCPECRYTLIQTQINSRPEEAIGVFFYNNKEGNTKVYLKAEFTWPEEYKNQNKILSTEEQVSAINYQILKANVMFGLKENQGIQYMLPKNVEFNLKQNFRNGEGFSFKIINNNNSNQIATMDQYGRIKTYWTTGVVTINAQGKWTQQFPLFVENYESIFIENTHSIIELEKGHSINLDLIIQHESGMQFANRLIGFPLDVKLSHPHLATAKLIEENSKLKITGTQPGYTNIILINKSDFSIYDVFTIKIVEQFSILNEITIPIGGTVEFYKKKKDKQDEMFRNIKIKSNDTNLIYIDDRRGIIRGMKEGFAMISFINKETGVEGVRTIIRIVKISNIYLDLKEEISEIVNGEQNNKPYKVPIIYKTEDEIKLTIDEDDLYSEIRYNFILNCKTNDTKSIIIGQENDIKNNKNYCLITPKMSNFDINDKQHKNRYKIQIEFDVYYNTGNYYYDNYNNYDNNYDNIPNTSNNKISNKMNIQYQRAFRISPTTSAITLTSNVKGEICLNDIRDIEVNVENENRIKIIGRKEDLGQFEYVVLNANENLNSEKIKLTNKITGQTDYVFVSYVQDKDNNDNAGIDILKYLIVLGLISVTAIYISYHQNLKNAIFSLLGFDNNYNNRMRYPTRNGNYLDNNNFMMNNANQFDNFNNNFNYNNNYNNNFGNNFGNNFDNNYYNNYNNNNNNLMNNFNQINNNDAMNGNFIRNNNEAAPNFYYDANGDVGYN